MKITYLIILLLALCNQGFAIDKRSRSEGIPGLSASNTLGTGNIWFGANAIMFVQTSRILGQGLDDNIQPSEEQRDTFEKDLILSPRVNATIGLTHFAQLEVNSIPYDGEKIGLTMASMKLTHPGEDNLRIWGFAGKVNIALATEENSSTALEETPAFDPILSFSAIADVDFIKVNPKLPYKTYLNYSNHDNFRYHNIYQQHHISLGLEHKKEDGSLYIRTGIALYKEKKSNFNNKPKEDFLSPFYDLGLGVKKRFTQKFPFVLLADLSFDPVSPLGFLDSELSKPIKLEISIRVPVFYKETNTEALRSLIFSEQRRLKNKNKLSTVTIKKRSSADLTLNRLLLENFERDLLDDKVLNEVFKTESKQAKMERHKKTIEALGLKEEGSE